MEETGHLLTNFDCPSVHDIAGHKIRIFGVMSKYIEAIGGMPASIPYSDIYMALKLGTVDGSTNGAQALDDIKLKEVVKNCVVFPNMGFAESLVFNKDSFDALPEDIQDILMTASPVYNFTAGGTLKLQQELTAKKAAEEYGITLHAWSDEDVKYIRQQCAEKIWSVEAAKSARSQEMYDIIVQYQKMMGLID